MEQNSPTEKAPTVAAPPALTPAQKARARADALAVEAQQARAKAQRLEAMERAKEAGVRRAEETRRKVLLGAYLLAQVKAEGWDLSALHIGQQPLADYLTRDDDRALFGLPPIPVLTTLVQQAEGAEAPPASQPAD